MGKINLISADGLKAEIEGTIDKELINKLSEFLKKNNIEYRQVTESKNTSTS